MYTETKYSNRYALNCCFCKNSKFVFSFKLCTHLFLLTDTHMPAAKTISKGLPQPEGAPKTFQCEECGKVLKQLTVCNDCLKVPFCSNECVNKCVSHKRYCKPKTFGFLDPIQKQTVDDYIDATEWFLVAKKDIKFGDQVLVDEPLMAFTMLDDPKNIVNQELKESMFGPEEIASRYYCIDDPELFGPLYRDTPNVDISEQDIGVKMAYALCREHTWLTLEQCMRLTWIEESLNEQQSCHRRFKVVQQQLKRICATAKGICPYDVYKLVFHMGPCLTQIHSRATSDIVLEGLFMNAWKLTKSCNPNCIAFLFEGRLIVNAIRDIKEGESISIGFSGLNQSRGYRDRTNVLKLMYGIKDCICDRCVSEAIQLKESANNNNEPEEEGKKETWISDVNFKDERSMDVVSSFIKTLHKIVSTSGDNLITYLDADLDTTLKAVTLMNNDDFTQVYRIIMFFLTSYISTGVVRAEPWVKEKMIESQDFDLVTDVINDRMTELETYRQQLIQKLRFKFGVEFYGDITPEIDPKTTPSVYIESLLNSLLHIVKLNQEDMDVLYQLYKAQNDEERENIKKQMGGVSDNHATQVEEIRAALRVIKKIINHPVLYYDMAMMNIDPSTWSRNYSFYMGKEEQEQLKQLGGN